MMVRGRGEGRAVVMDLRCVVSNGVKSGNGGRVGSWVGKWAALVSGQLVDSPWGGLEVQVVGGGVVVVARSISTQPRWYAPIVLG
jgi:hypothetical protein